MGKRPKRLKGGAPSRHRNPDGSVSQSTSRGDPRERKLAHLVGAVQWDGDGRELEPVDVVPEQPGFLVTVHNFLTPYECKQLRKVFDEVGLNPASKADLKPRKNEAFLNRESLACPNELLYNKMWGRLEPLAPSLPGRRAVGLLEKLRYYRYERGHRFDAHVDVSNKGTRRGEQTEYTMLVYLNGGGDLEGGETIFWETKRKELCRIEPEEGKLLLHAHGDRCLMHAGAEVTRGSKYVLRSDVMYGPSLKEEAEESERVDAYRPRKRDYTV